MTIPALRIRSMNGKPVSPDGEYVLYWMVAFRRSTYNFSLQRAVDWARKLNKPLVVLEALRCDYQWASDRLHQFIVEGMADNAEGFATKSVTYYPYVEPRKGAGRGLLKQLAEKACVVVSDDFPAFFLPRMFRAAADRVPVQFELIDSNGMLPMRAAGKVFARAFDFRRFLQKNLLPHLAEVPKRDPLARAKLPTLRSLPAEVRDRWPAAEPKRLLDDPTAWEGFPIDHAVGKGGVQGGSRAAENRLKTFLHDRLSRYESDRNQPEGNANSGLSPYLHFGHVSPHHIFESLIRQAEWTPGNVQGKPNGSASGWWGAESAVESFLDELITWRELGYNMCWQRDDYDQFESLPQWAQDTLQEHTSDPRQHVYTLDQFAAAATHNELWNAAQRQLIREGTIHNYLRMVWGKKLLEWSSDPREALRIMIELNNRYALDGRNPNSYSGILWVLGRYDRAWGPERAVFGKIRYMSCENTARKIKVKQYLQRYAADDRQRGFDF